MTAAIAWAPRSAGSSLPPDWNNHRMHRRSFLATPLLLPSLTGTAALAAAVDYNGRRLPGRGSRHRADLPARSRRPPGLSHRMVVRHRCPRRAGAGYRLPAHLLPQPAGNCRRLALADRRAPDRLRACRADDSRRAPAARRTRRPRQSRCRLRQPRSGRQHRRLADVPAGDRRPRVVAVAHAGSEVFLGAVAEPVATAAAAG